MIYMRDCNGVGQHGPNLVQLCEVDVFLEEIY